MKNYIFNDRGVCINPDKREWKVGQLYAAIKTACTRDGKWVFGKNMQFCSVNMHGSISPCAWLDLPWDDYYNSQQEAERAAIKSLIEDINHDRNEEPISSDAMIDTLRAELFEQRQLSLFD